MNDVITKHKLDFECTPYHIQVKGEPMLVNFRVGTCHGLYSSTDNSYDIIAVTNREIGNGHFDDVIEWFENSCKRDKKSLRFLEIINDDFKKHLIKKRGFRDIGEGNVEKPLIKIVWTIEYLRENNLILLEVLSGSQAYGTATENSDMDIRGVFCFPKENILGMDYVEQVEDEKNDVVFYELKKFFHLLTDKNPSPNLLELLNAPEDCIIYKHPIMNLMLDQKDKFITKKCEESFGEYAVEQIRKARGLNKKIVQKMEKERKTPLDFCYVIDETGYGTIPVRKWLESKNYKQENCGLSKIPNMRDAYALFHSFYNRPKGEPKNDNMDDFKGIIQNEKSNDVSLSSIPKGAKTQCTLSFNKDGYSKYCKQYREYWDWDKNKNPHRFNETVMHGKGYDGKNLAHCHRLLDMAIEIAEGKGVIVRRTNRDQLLSIRRGEYDYDQLLKEASEKIETMNKLFAISKLPSDVKRTFADNLLVSMREKIYGNIGISYEELVDLVEHIYLNAKLGTLETHLNKNPEKIILIQNVLNYKTKVYELRNNKGRKSI